MMKKECCKDGKKFLLVWPRGFWGTNVVWADKIKDFRVCDLETVAEGEALLLKADGENVVRIKRNGAKWYE